MIADGLHLTVIGLCLSLYRSYIPWNLLLLLTKLKGRSYCRPNAASPFQHRIVILTMRRIATRKSQLPSEIAPLSRYRNAFPTFPCLVRFPGIMPFKPPVYQGCPIYILYKLSLYIFLYVFFASFSI